MTEDEEGCLYVGRYVSREEFFPSFEAVLVKLIEHVVSGLTAVDFTKRFGPEFRQVR